MDDGERKEVEAQLSVLYGDDETDDKGARRAQIINPDGTINPFQRRALQSSVERKQREDAKGPPASTPIPEVAPEYADDIPEPVPGYDDRPDLVGLIKGKVDILSAAQSWGKSHQIKTGNRREGIHVRCPFPAHIDNNPSAWINLDKDTWYCGKCEVGGDQIDFYAAATHSLHPDDFHRSTEFRTILIEICHQVGIDPDPSPPSPLPVQEDDDVVVPMLEPEIPAAPDNTAPTTPMPSIAALDPDPDKDPVFVDPLEESGLPSYDWQNLDIAPGTFLSDWMIGNIEDLPSIPQEFFIMLGFQAVGLACGHHVQTVTDMGVLNASLLLTLVGPSGEGKSLALERLVDLFNEIPASKWNFKIGSGIKVITTPGSPEALLMKMRHEIEDPQDPLRKEEVPITGFLHEDELATFLFKAGRKGGEHMKQRVMGFHDFRKRRLEPELVFSDDALSTGERNVYDSYFAATWGTQPAVLRRQIEDHDMYSGFMNRVIPVFGPRRVVADVRKRWNLQTPVYVPAWEKMWRRLRGAPLLTKIEISTEALQYVHVHPLWILMNSYQDRDDLSILSRIRQNCHRLALILAVNDGSSKVEPRHYDSVFRFVEGYLQKCYAMFVSAAKATESKDIKEKLLEFLHREFKNTQRWPTRRKIARQRFWAAASEQVQRIALDNLLVNRQIAMVNLKEGQRTTEVCIATDMDGYWASYASMNGKIFNNEKDMFYAHT